jgi:hypothetical protein
MLNYQALPKKNRFQEYGGLLALFAGVSATVASITVVTAQTAFEFEDPLEDLREQLGMPATDGAQGAGAGGQASAAADGAGGMSSFGLFAIASAILLALVVALVWWLGRKRRARRHGSDSDHDLYVTEDDSPPRHVLESGSAVTRERSGRLDTREEIAPSKTSFSTAAKATAATTAAASAAMILSDEVDPAEEKPLDADKQDSADRNDPDNWKKPNLDRLKDSIREEWPSKAASDASATAAAATGAVAATASGAAISATESAKSAVDTAATRVDDFRSDNETFDAMFGDDADPVEYPAAHDTSFAGQIEDIATDDNASVTDHDLGVGAGSMTAPNIPSRNDALKRIKALRESVKAG